MQQIDVCEYNHFLNMADGHDCGKIYPCSIAEGIQHGEIFTDAIHDYRAVLFWHHCGFAYLAGQPDDCFLEEIYERILDRNNTNHYQNNPSAKIGFKKVAECTIVKKK